MVLYPLTSNQQIRSHIACYFSISSKYPMKGGSGFSCFPMFPQDVLKLWHIKFSPKAGSSTFASKSTMASLKVLIFSDSGGTWLEGNPCHAALKSSAPNKPLKDILSSRHSYYWYILIHCFGTVVGLGAPQEWKCSQTQFLWAEKMVFVSPAGWSLKAPLHHHWRLRLQMLKKPAENLRCTYCTWLPQSNNNQLNNHPLAPEVSGSTCKPVIFLQGKEGSIKKKSLCAASKNFPEKCRKPMAKLRLNSIFIIRGTTPCCHSASRMRATLRASAIPRCWDALNIWWCHPSGDATHALQMEMNRWRWNIFQITGDLKISICLVLPLIPPTHKGFTYILCNQRCPNPARKSEVHGSQRVYIYINYK